MRMIIALFALLLVVGCVKKDSVRYVTLPPKAVEQVALLPGPPDKPFKVVGHVFIEGHRAANWQALAEAAREEAANIGADAVFMGEAGEYQAGSIIVPGHSATTTTGTLSGSMLTTRSSTFGGPSIALGVQRKRMTAIAIVYQQPE